MSAKSTKCEFCGNRTIGCTGLCRTCKSALHNGYKRIEAERLLVDLAGGSWWVWDAKGTVLVIGRNSRRDAVIALHLDEVVS